MQEPVLIDADCVAEPLAEALQTGFRAHSSLDASGLRVHARIFAVVHPPRFILLQAVLAYMSGAVSSVPTDPAPEAFSPMHPRRRQRFWSCYLSRLECHYCGRSCHAPS